MKRVKTRLRPRLRLVFKKGGRYILLPVEQDEGEGAERALVWTHQDWAALACQRLLQGRAAFVECRGSFAGP